MAGARIVFGSSGVYFGQDNKYVSRHSDVVFAQSQSVTSLQDTEELHEAWENVIRRYSKFTSTSFTNPTDLLPALSGLARLFGTKLRTEYVAGHWKDRLHYTLLWRYESAQERPSLDDITKRHDGGTYLVPSWSWLTRGRTCFPFSLHISQFDVDPPRCQSEINILDFYQKLDGKDPYGAIHDACLTLEGFVLDRPSLAWFETSRTMAGAVGIREENVWCGPPRFRSYRPCDGGIDILDPKYTPEMEEDDHFVVDFDINTTGVTFTSLQSMRASLHELISQVTLLLVASGEKNGPYPLKGKRGYGLALAPMAGGEERSFFRVGTFSTYPKYYKDSLSGLRRSMKKETIKIF